MKPLEPLDTHHLNAAVGWLGLGNWREANEELEKITANLRAHPDVLEIRWEIYAQAGKWLESIDIAHAITKLDPSRPFGWVHLAYALHELERTQEAYETITLVLSRFPKEQTLRYNLACYACRLGKFQEAFTLLKEVFSKSDAKELKLRALDDPDLQGLWEKIGSL